MEYLVDILMPVYNHEKFLEDALNGVVKQRTNFNFRLLIGEDCSTDNSRLIIERFRNNYPTIIFPAYRQTNLGAHKNGELLFKEMSSKYVAICEGDDYWTDLSKLQKQIDFLEGHTDYAICFHGVHEMEKDKEPVLCQLTDLPKTYTIEDLASSLNFIHTVSVVFRLNFREFPDWFNQVPAADYALHMLNASYGKIYYMPEPMGVYRKFTGIWGPQNLLHKYTNWCKSLGFLIRHFDDEKVLQLLRKQQAYWLLYLYNNDADKVYEQEPLVKEILDMVIIKSPEQMARFKTKFLFLSFCKKLVLLLKHNPFGNRLASFRIKNK